MSWPHDRRTTSSNYWACLYALHMLVTVSLAYKSKQLLIWTRGKYLGGSCEGHFVYAHVRSDCGSRRWPESWQNIDDSWWKPGLSKQYERKQALAEMTTEPSKTTGGVGESEPNPTSLPAENGENIKKEEGNRQIVSKKRRGQGGDREDVNTLICTAW